MNESYNVKTPARRRIPSQVVFVTVALYVSTEKQTVIFALTSLYCIGRELKITNRVRAWKIFTPNRLLQ